MFPKKGSQKNGVVIAVGLAALAVLAEDVRQGAGVTNIFPRSALTLA